MRKQLLAACAVVLLASACARDDGLGDVPGGPGSALDPAAQGGLSGGQLDPTSTAYFTQVIGDRVFFLVDQSSLTPQAMSTLDQQAQWMLSNPGLPVTIEGHADEQGTREYNIALSARRASAVRNYLVTKGVPDSRLSTVPFGKERPVEVCSEERCWSQNRRAVTVVTGAPGS